jgi:predicted transposase YbfD/YdcC
MPAVALSRAGARVAGSGPGGQVLAAGAWQRLEVLPDPGSPQGRIYPLACLVAIAVCAFTAAGNDRFTAVGQWVKRASQADVARLRAPWYPIAGRYRAPDEKTIRVVLDRLDPRALARALLGPGPAQPPAPRRAAGARRAQIPCPALRPAGQDAGPGPAAGRGRRRQDLPRGPPRRRHPGLPARRRRARRAPAGPPRGRRQAQRDQPLHRTPGIGGPGRRRGDLRRTPHGAGEPGLAGHGQQGALHRDREAQPAAAARAGQGPALAAVPAGSITRDTGHGRTGNRTLKTAHVSRLDFPGARQAITIARWRQDTATGRTSRQTAYAVTSLTSADATAQDLARLVREHWSIEAHHHVRDATFGEDASAARTGIGPVNLATIRAAIIAAVKDAGYLHIPEGRRDHTTPAETLGLHGLD